MAYVAGDLLVRALMFSTTGLPEDTCVTDFAFRKAGAAPTDAEIDDAFNAVDTFYRGGAAAINQVGSYIGDAIDRSATHELQAYTISAGPSGPPRLTSPWLGPVNSLGTQNMPTECAGVLSFHADLTGVFEEAGATRPRARRRGRIYVGPLNNASVETDTPQPYLTDAFRAALQARAVAMHDMAEGDGWTWSVWSRVDAVLRPVVGGWTDNAIDTQRRRGTDATNRSTFGPL